MKNQHSHLVSLVLLTVLLVTACGKEKATSAPTDIPQTTLVISGSGTTTSILSGVKLAFEADVPGYSLDVLPGTGTGSGIQGVIEGMLDVAAMARPLKDEELSQGLEFVEFGQSGVCLYTHLGVDVTDLSTAQVTAILAGEITNWSQVGGADQDIVLYVRDEAESSTQALREVVIGETSFSADAQFIASQSDMQAAVSSTPGSMGFGSWPSAVAAGAELKSIILDGVAPDDPAYPMTASVGIGYKSDRQADVQPLVDWLFSAPGQAALGELGVITGR